MKRMLLVGCLALSGCEPLQPETPQYNAHVEDFLREQRIEENSCSAGMKFGGGMGVSLGGCGAGLVLGFDGKIGFGFGF